MMRNRERIIRLIRKRLAAYAPESAYLFGSYARDEADDVSDVDLVVIKETEESFFDRQKSVLRALQLDLPVDVLVYTPGEFDSMVRRGNIFAELILEEGVNIYGDELRHGHGSQSKIVGFSKL